jgi:hypothetical protein
VHYLAGAEREDYGASPKMVRVTCRHAMPGVGSMGSPEWCALGLRLVIVEYHFITRALECRSATANHLCEELYGLQCI